MHVAELDEGAWLLGRIEDWLLHAHDDTIADWTEFYADAWRAHIRDRSAQHVLP